MTVIEKVNNRPTRLVITNDDQIKHFKTIYSKSPFTTSNYEENVTINNGDAPVNNIQNTVNPNKINVSSSDTKYSTFPDVMLSLETLIGLSI